MERNRQEKKLLVSRVPGGIRVDGIRDFEPEHTFECGQCFRWTMSRDGTYTGIVGGKCLRIRKVGDSFLFLGITPEEWETRWVHYFDLSVDYGEIKKNLAARDPIMEKAIAYGYGIRLLRQDFWEVMISFILSANNNIPRIKKIIRNLSTSFGEPIPDNQTVQNGGFDSLMEARSGGSTAAMEQSEALFAFPRPEVLCRTNPDELQLCRAGYRCRFIHEAACIMTNGKLLPEEWNGISEEEKRKKLMNVPGVGEKVADCILLYSGLCTSVFPVDVWIKRVMESLYFHRPVTNREIREFAREKFGEYAGYAQQYLFFYARENL